MVPSPAKRSWLRLAIVAVLAAATASIGLFASQRHHFVHHNDRLLLALASSTSIRVTLHAKNPKGHVVTGLLFPRTENTQLTLDGRLSYTSLGHEYNFTVVHNRGYVTVQDVKTHALVRNECLERDSIPPLHLVVDALRDARVIDAAEDYDIDCHDGKLVEFVFANEPYVFCSRANGAIDKIHGHDLAATVELLQENTADAPSLASLRRQGSETVDTCELLVDTPTQQKPSTVSRTLSRARDVATLLSGKRRLADSSDCSKTCKDGKKICLFVHGLGKKLDGSVVDEYPEAWGEAAWKDMPCCSQTKFVRMDTIGYPWYTALLANKVCDAAMALTKSKDPMNLENIAIMSHSMGNLIVASAAMKGLCAVGPTSKWIALAGPISGSKSANVGTGVCNPERPPVAAVNETVQETLMAVNLCPAKRGTQSLVYKATDASFAELDLMYTHAIDEFRKRVTSSLCGVSSVGLASLLSAKYTALALISGHGSPSDGAVEINSCASAFGVDAYQTSWRGGRFYRASVNHGDAVLRNGDGLWGDDRKPLKWLNCQF